MNSVPLAPKVPRNVPITCPDLPSNRESSGALQTDKAVEEELGIIEDIFAVKILGRLAIPFVVAINTSRSGIVLHLNKLYKTIAACDITDLLWVTFQVKVEFRLW
jgi:hypothetical protein